MVRGTQEEGLQLIREPAESPMSRTQYFCKFASLIQARRDGPINPPVGETFCGTRCWGLCVIRRNCVNRNGKWFGLRNN